VLIWTVAPVAGPPGAGESVAFLLRLEPVPIASAVCPATGEERPPTSVWRLSFERVRLDMGSLSGAADGISTGRDMTESGWHVAEVSNGGDDQIARCGGNEGPARVVGERRHPICEGG
jgi:hypothetical protein